MKILLPVVAAFLPVIGFAQIECRPMPIEKATTNPTDKDKNGIYKTQRIKDKTTGTGLYSLKNGDIYIGDFRDKKFNGRGLYICAESNFIENCPGAKIFSGHFKDGIKSGKGVCYDEEGKVIYEGKFVDNSPVDTFPQDVDSSLYAGDLLTEDFYFVGELEAGAPGGYGAVFFPSGDFVVSRYKDGERFGNTVYVYEDGNWKCEKVESGATVVPISSSYEYDDFAQQRKTAVKESVKVAGQRMEQIAAEKRRNQTSSGFLKALNYFGQALIAAGGAIDQYNSYSYSNDNSDSSSAGGSSRSDKSSKGSAGSKYNMSEQRSYNTDKSTYSKYDSMLSQYYAGNRDASASEVKEWTLKMRSLRTKWESKGKSFPHSANEDR